LGEREVVVMPLPFFILGGVATAYGIPKASVVGKVSEDTSKSDAKLCCHCGVEVSLEDKNCPKCGKKSGYLKDNESQHEGE